MSDEGLGGTHHSSLSSLFLLLGLAPERSRPSQNLFVWADWNGLGAGDGDELLLAAHRHAVGLLALVFALGVERPALDVVRERDGKDLLLEARDDRLRADRERHFHS